MAARLGPDLEAGLTIQDDQEVDCRVGFDDVDAAVRAFTGAEGQVRLPAWYRVVLAQA
jgi:hypothetical protein